MIWIPWQFCQTLIVLNKLLAEATNPFCLSLALFVAFSRFLFFIRFSSSASAEAAVKCNLTGRCPFFKNIHNPFRKKFAFRYPVSELLDYKKFQKQ